MKHKPALIAAFSLVGVAAAAPAFIPTAPIGFLFLLPAVVVGLAAAAGSGGGLLSAVVASVALGAGGQRAFGVAALPPLSATVAALWIMVFLIERRRQALTVRRKLAENALEAQAEQGRQIQKDLDFYAERTRALSQRALVRRQLSSAARELGALLDPGEIQERLVQLARDVFGGAEVNLWTGTSPSAVATRAFERGQAIVVPGDRTGARSEMAVPLRAARSVVGALHVSADPRQRVFTNEDLRLLDVLSSLASEALGNGLLFEQVQQNALRDGLTGLLTHRAFHERLETAILEASRYRQPISIILSDVDHFKTVNDTHGHPAGDAVLQGIAHVLDRNVRDVDVIARYGGEEFVILLYQTPYQDALALAERIRQDIAQQPFDADGKALHATVSFGVAAFPEDATSAQQLMRQADQSLYAAKKAGRNRVVGRIP